MKLKKILKFKIVYYTIGTQFLVSLFIRLKFLKIILTFPSLIFIDFMFFDNIYLVHRETVLFSLALGLPRGSLDAYGLNSITYF